MLRYTYLFLIILLISHCSPKATTQDIKYFQFNDQPASPENCLLVVEVKSIDQSKRDNLAPCDEKPCYTQLVIVSIKSRGSSFSNNFKIGETINSKFKYSLEGNTADTNKILLPKVSEGDRLIVDVEGSLFPSASDLFVIRKYQLL